MVDNISPGSPRRFGKAKLNRWQFITLNFTLGILGIAAIVSLVYFAPAYAPGSVAIIVLLLMIAGYALRMLRLNDISPETQMKFWKSGNMFFVSGWMHLLAPSWSSMEGSLDEVVSSPSFSDPKERMKLVGRNFLRWFVVYIVLMAIIFGYSLYASRLTEQQVLNQPLTTAHLVLSLGNNESTTLSMAVPGGYVAGFDVGAGTIFPTSSLGRETPNVGFYSEVASQDSLNRSAQQTILDTETQIHYADADQLTVNTATGTFLGYPAWIMTSKSDRPAETIVFQPASSTNMIEIRIIYSPSDPASEHQVVDGILNSITISTSIGTSSTRETVAATSSMPVIINQSKKGSITTQPSISILSPSGGETWQLGQTQTVRWSSTGITTLTIYVHFSDGGMCREAILPASPGSGSFVLNPICPGITKQLTPGQYTIGIIDSDLHSNGITAWSQPFKID